MLNKFFEKHIKECFTLPSFPQVQFSRWISISTTIIPWPMYKLITCALLQVLHSSCALTLMPILRVLTTKNGYQAFAVPITKFESSYTKIHRNFVFLSLSPSVCVCVSRFNIHISRTTWKLFRAGGVGQSLDGWMLKWHTIVVYDPPLELKCVLRTRMGLQQLSGALHLKM